jgi:uncharacterized OB-fold protein
MTRHLGDDWMLPQLDEHNREWFTRGTLAVQHCDDCQTLQHPPEELCCGCRGENLSYRECSGEGRVESVIVVHQAVHPGLKDRVPYAVVLVSLDDAPGVNAMGNVLNREPSEISIGQAVRAVFEEVAPSDGGDRLLIPQWEVVS